MRTNLDTPVLGFYQDVYRLDKHPAPDQANTVAMYENELRNLNRAFHFHLAEKGLPLRDVRLGDLVEPADGEDPPTLRADDLLKYAMAWQLGRKRTKDTANKLYRVTCAVWREAFDRRIVPAPPRTKKLKENVRKPQAWALDEMLAIIDAAGEEAGHVGGALAKVFFPAYCWCTYAVGSRQSVTLKTPAENFDARRGMILLPAELQKQGADQWLELIPEAAAAIARLRSRQRGLERLFGDWTYSISYFNARLRRIIVRAGLRDSVDKVTRWDLSHKFRRTFATHVTANSDEETARKLLGHSHISVTRRYLDERFLPTVSARAVVPPLRGPADEPPTPAGEPALRIHRPEAG